MERKRTTAASHKSDAIKKQIIEFLMEGYSVQKAMDAVGRSVKTYEYYRKTDPSFGLQIDKVRSMTARGEIGQATTELPPFPEFSSKYLGVEVFTHQKHWIDLLEGTTPSDVHPSIIYEPGDPDLIIVNTPPEHAKSTTITVNYALYQICRNPNIRILVVSKTQAMAQKFLLSIKNRLTHPRYQDLHLAFGPPGGFEKNSDSWKQDLIYLSSEARNSGEKDPTVQAIGIRGHIYGARADLIIMDDCVDHTNAHEYEKQIDWIQSEVMSRIDNDGGKLLVVGTRLRPKDLYSELRDPMRYPDETSPWTYFAQPAVLEFYDEPKDWVTLWAKTNMPPVSGKGIPDENGLYTKWDGDALFKKRGRMSPNLWAMVYQQQQVHEDAVFPGDSVKGVINGARNIGIIPKNKAGNRLEGMDGLVVVAGLDPAMAGYTAAVCIGIDVSTQKRYLLDVSNQQGMKPDDIRTLIKDWTDKYSISEWRVEKNAFQAMLTQDREVREYLQTRGATLKEHHTGNNKWDTDFGVASLTTLFHGYEEGLNLIEFPSTHQSEGLKALIEQLVTWYPDAPRSQKTDCVMAFWFAELAVRDRVANASMFARTHNSFNMFQTKYDKSQQMTVNLNDYAYTQ
jgi:FMN phosphatase YigB (HAD superfamily)